MHLKSQPQPSRTGKILKVTGLIAMLGAVGGALGGVVIATIMVAGAVISGSPDPWPGLAVYGMITGTASLVGAGFGVVLGPLFAWTLLRRAPLWRAIGETALAAALGAGLSLELLPVFSFLDPFKVPFVAALLASSAAAVRLRYSYARTERIAAVEPVESLNA